MKNELFDNCSLIFILEDNFKDKRITADIPIKTVIGKMLLQNTLIKLSNKKSPIPKAQREFETLTPSVRFFWKNNCIYPPIEKKTSPRISILSNGIAIYIARRIRICPPHKTFQQEIYQRGYDD